MSLRFPVTNRKIFTLPLNELGAAPKNKCHMKIHGR